MGIPLHRRMGRIAGSLGLAFVLALSLTPGYANGENIVASTFDGDDGSWIAYGAPLLNNGQLCVDVPGGTVNPWDVGLLHNDLGLVLGRSYDLAFTASASVPAQVNLSVQTADPPFTQALAQSSYVTPTAQTFQFAFPWSIPGRDQILFQLGGNNTAFRFCLGNISLTEVPDTDPPTITYDLDPAPNLDGWNNTDVTVVFTCTDALSGVKYCPPPTDVLDEGTTTITASAVDNADNASPPVVVTVRIDRTAPVLGQPTLATNPKPTGVSTTLNVPAADNLSGVTGGEYYLDTGPATPMLYDGGNLTATIGTNLTPGVYQIGIRGHDAAGNWTIPISTIFVVYNPAVSGGVTGKNKKDLIPNLTNGDIMPGLASTTQTDPVDYGFTVDLTSAGLDPRNDFMMTYNTGSQCHTPHAQNCHTLTVTATHFDWLVVDQTNNSRGRFQGTATATIDGDTTTNPFTVEGIDGDRLSPATDDHITIKIYATGANPATDNPIYQVSGSVPRGKSFRRR